MRKICRSFLLLAFCGQAFSSVLSQPSYARELWTAYNNAPDFTAQKDAFVKLEKFYRVYHLDSCLLLCNQFKEVAAKLQPEYVPMVDLRIAATYTRQLEYEKAGNIILPILERAEKEGKDSLRASALLNLAALNIAQKQYEIARKRAFEAADLHKKMQNWRDLCADYTAVANAYSIQGGTGDSALIYHQRALEIAQKHQLPDIRGTVLNNIGVHYHRKDDLEQAIQNYKEATVYFKESDERFILCFGLLNIGHAYRKLERWSEAKTWYDEAMPVCESCGNVEGVGSIHMGMADVHEHLGDYKSALAAQKKLNETDLKLNEQTYNRATQTLEAKYGAEKKERELSEQRAQNFRQQAGLYSLGAVFVAFLGFGYLFYNRFRLRKKVELDAAIIREQKLGLNAVIEAQETERKRIARDLHDGVAQELVALKLGFDALGRRVGKIAPHESARFSELGEQLNASCTEVRNVAHLMSPPGLEQQGLAPSLDLLLRHMLQNAGLDTKLHAYNLPLHLDEKTEIGLYRIAQELLNNIVKHAHAAKVAVELFQKENYLVLRVEDDGVGYNFEEARAKGSMGLLNVISRTSALGGEFLAENKSPRGSVALVRVPI
jgi:two-component system NarL family sensor kinase